MRDGVLDFPCTFKGAVTSLTLFYYLSLTFPGEDPENKNIVRTTPQSRLAKHISLLSGRKAVNQGKDKKITTILWIRSRCLCLVRSKAQPHSSALENNVIQIIRTDTDLWKVPWLLIFLAKCHKCLAGFWEGGMQKHSEHFIISLKNIHFFQFADPARVHAHPNAQQATPLHRCFRSRRQHCQAVSRIHRESVLIFGLWSLAKFSIENRLHVGVTLTLLRTLSSWIFSSSREFFHPILIVDTVSPIYTMLKRPLADPFLIFYMFTSVRVFDLWSLMSLSNFMARCRNYRRWHGDGLIFDLWSPDWSLIFAATTSSSSTASSQDDATRRILEVTQQYSAFGTKVLEMLVLQRKWAKFFFEILPNNLLMQFWQENHGNASFCLCRAKYFSDELFRQFGQFSRDTTWMIFDFFPGWARLQTCPHWPTSSSDLPPHPAGNCEK